MANADVVQLPSASSINILAWLLIAQFPTSGLLLILEDLALVPREVDKFQIFTSKGSTELIQRTL
jgi:hypothetical protein